MEVGFHTFPGGKQYAYVKKGTGTGTGTGTGQAPIFLRNIIFLTQGSDTHTIAIVRDWGANPRTIGIWEPPKGQMEWKELNSKPHTILSQAVIQAHMRKGVVREMMEEAKILPTEIKHLRMLPLYHIQDWPESGIRGAQFMYQFWTAEISNKTMLEAQKRIKVLVDHPDLASMLPSDVREKNAIQWWNPARGGDDWRQIRGAFSKKMTRMYYAYIDSYGVQ